MLITKYRKQIGQLELETYVDVYYNCSMLNDFIVLLLRYHSACLLILAHVCIFQSNKKKAGLDYVNNVF